MINIINIQHFNEIVTGIKAMKSDLVCVYRNMLYGVDNTFSVLKTYQMNMEIPVTPFVIITKTLSGEFYNNITDTEIIVDFDKRKLYCPNNASFADECDEMIDLAAALKILDSARAIISITNSNRNIHENYGDITDDENFQRFKSIRSGDGAELYVPKGVRGHAMYLYSGAIPMVKADKVSLDVYDFGDTFISKFTVTKKKANRVNVYFRFVKLSR